jgi:hypothetical protein
MDTNRTVRKISREISQASKCTLQSKLRWFIIREPSSLSHQKWRRNNKIPTVLQIQAKSHQRGLPKSSSKELDRIPVVRNQTKRRTRRRQLKLYLFFSLCFSLFGGEKSGGGGYSLQGREREREKKEKEGLFVEEREESNRKTQKETRKNEMK